MKKAEHSAFYLSYISCLNMQDWSNLGNFVGIDVTYNDKQIGLTGYRALLEKDFREIPDLQFDVQLLISDPPYIVSRLKFNCTPIGTFMDLPVNGQKISFFENVIYEVQNRKIVNVWSVIEKAAIEAQLRN